MSSRFQRRVIDEFADGAGAQGRLPSDEAGRLWRERITILLQARVGHLDRPDRPGGAAAMSTTC